MESHARHAAFMPFARTIDVEIAEADNLRVRFWQDLTHIFIEQEFRVAIDVQRLFVLAGFNKVGGASAVGGSRRGIQERDFVLQAIVQQLLGVLIVVIHHILAVPLGGGRTSAFMENGINIVKLFARHDLNKEVFFIHIISDVEVNQVGKLGAIFQVINHQDVGNAFIIQGFNDVTTDKTRAASHNDHTLTFEIVGTETVSDTNVFIIPSQRPVFSFHRQPPAHA